MSAWSENHFPGRSDLDRAYPVDRRDARSTRARSAPRKRPVAMSDALLIAAHGSRDEAGVEEFWALAHAWQRFRPDRLQAAGFLEFIRPTIGEAIDALVDRGA